jgi:hypothetical protein
MIKTRLTESIFIFYSYFLVEDCRINTFESSVPGILINPIPFRILYDELGLTKIFYTN